MHSDASHIDIGQAVEADPIQATAVVKKFLWTFVSVGIAVFVMGFLWAPPKIFWGSFHTNLFFWTGLAAGGVVTTAIFQIVRATWSPPLRRIAEANSAFLPWAFLAFLVGYFGRESLFPWANGPMPGREWWMQPDFVYGRFVVLLGFLFFMMWRYVRMSLRGDIGLIREKLPKKDRWFGLGYGDLVKDWKGSEIEIPELQRKLSWNGPLLIALYAIIYSLFAFEMLMSMDTVWYSNMFAGFIFVGNVYLAWSVIAITAVAVSELNEGYGRFLGSGQLWDVGKLMFGFCMLWGYLFFSQFLPQWYGNLPEETQWMMLRSRELPWKTFGWFVFGCSFVLPFLMLLSRDVKRSRYALSSVAAIICVGIWCEKYIIVMPTLSPGSIPIGVIDIGLTMGFFGIYALSIFNFLSKYPYVPVSHPLTRGSNEW